MLDFLKRIPAMLGLGGKGTAKPARPKLVVVSDSDSPVKKRGRGTGRGVTPPAKPRPKPGVAQRRKK
jgi:hypothetical protein